MINVRSSRSFFCIPLLITVIAMAITAGQAFADYNVTISSATSANGSWSGGAPDIWVPSATGSNVAAAEIESRLNAGTSVVLTTSGSGTENGDITVNDAVTWSALSSTLTCSAYRNVTINANITATGNAARLTLTPSNAGAGGSYSLQNGAVITLSGATPSLTIAGYAYTVINDVNTLQGMGSGRYALGSNIDAAATATWNAGAGFAPVDSFTGTFDGLNHTITGLIINKPSSSAGYVGLFGVASGSDIRNVGLVGGSVTGPGNSNSVGGIVGFSTSSTIINSYCTGSVIGTGSNNMVGGLVGYSFSGAIANSYSTGGLTGDGSVGGLVGMSSNGSTVTNSYSTRGITCGAGGAGNFGGLVGYNFSSTIINSYSTGAVIGNNAVGGLVGMNSNGSTIADSYNTGSVSPGAGGAGEFGGLVGYNFSSTIINSYSTGAVRGNNTVGGLVGLNSSGGAITNSYSTGDISPGAGGMGDFGGLVGYNFSGTVSNSYSTGAVSGDTCVGGLVGQIGSEGTFTGSYWDAERPGAGNGIGCGTLDGATGSTTAQMMQQDNFSGWDFENTWRIYAGHTAPLLKNFLTPLTVTADDVSRGYDGMAYTSALTNPGYSVAGADSSGLLFNIGNPYNSATDVGSYPPDLYSTQQGYAISYVNGTLTIDPADTVPDAFSFIAQAGRTMNTLVTSNSVTVIGINAGSPVSVANGSYSVNSGLFTNLSGTVHNGDTVTVRQTSSGSCLTKTDATLTIGGVSGTFSVTTEDADITPGGFSFTAQTGRTISATITSNTIVVTGINTGAPISITGGEYQVNSGTWSSSTGTVNNNDAVTVRQTSSERYVTRTDTTLTIGGVSAVFSVTTMIDPLKDGTDTLSYGSLTWATGGDNPWSRVTTTSYYGGDSLQSGITGTNGMSWLQTQVTGTFTLSFFQKVSSQSSKDFLRFSIDGVEKGKIAGNVNWQQKLYSVTTGTAGTVHTLRWTYTKDASLTAGLDAGWIDMVRISSYAKLAITAPASGEVLHPGDTAIITWRAPAQDEKFLLYFYDGKIYTKITGTLTGSSYDWTVPETRGNNALCKIKIMAYSAAGKSLASVTSPKPFTIQELTVNSPNGGESITSGATTSIVYTAYTVSSVNSVRYSYTLTGTTWFEAGTGDATAATPGSHGWSWTVPPVVKTSAACKVKVEFLSSGGVVLATDLSDAAFTILSAPGGGNWGAMTWDNFKWQ